MANKSLTIDSEPMEDVKQDFNDALELLITKMIGKNVVEGKITLRINVALEATGKVDADTGEFKHYYLPRFDHKVKTSLKAETDELKGVFASMEYCVAGDGTLEKFTEQEKLW